MELNTGNKQTEVGVIPADWKVDYLQNITAFITKGSTPTTYGFKWQQTGVLFLRSECVSESGLDLTESMYISPEAHAFFRRSEVREGDILITITGNVGRVVFLKWIKYANINQHIARIRITAAEVDVAYVYHYLSQYSVRRYYNTIVTGQAYPQISLKQVRETPIPLPPTKTEQTAIANSLSDADALIQSLTSLIAKKRDIKQGATQILLNPYESGRLKAGWVVKKLGDIANVGRGRVISHKEINSSLESKYPVYSSQTSNDGVMGYIDTYDYEGEYITWTTDGVNAGKVFYRKGRFNCTNVCGTIKQLSENPVFVAMLLGRITPKYVSKNLANPKLMNDPVKRIELPLPKEQEQVRIASIISDMNTEITELEMKLAKYQQIKQGMMQNLLTGRTRLVKPAKQAEAAA